MTIPDYQSLMLPVSQTAQDGNEHRIRDVIEQLAKEFALTDDERRHLLPSGRQATFDNRVHWAKGYLSQARLGSVEIHRELMTAATRWIMAWKL